jgi:hypothetical protein
MPRIILYCAVGLLFVALGVYSLVTDEVLTRSGAILLESSPKFYWAWMTVYAAAAVVGFYKALTAYKLRRR